MGLLIVDTARFVLTGGIERAFGDTSGSSLYDAVQLPGTLAFVALSIAVGIYAAFMGNLLREERAGPSARLRELLLLLIVAYAVPSAIGLIGDAIGGSGAFGGGAAAAAGGAGVGGASPGDAGWRGYFYPRGYNVWPPLYAAAQWFLTALFQGAFRDREWFLEEIEGLRGAALQNAIRDDADLAEDALGGLRKIKSFCIGFAAILGIAWLGAVLFGLPRSPFSQFMGLPLFILVPIALGVIGQYSMEQYDAGAGLPPSSPTRTKRIRTILATTAASFAVALIVMGKSSPLPARWILLFFDWLSSLIPRREGQALEPPPPPKAPPPQGDPFKDMLSGLDSEPAIDLSWLWPIMNRLAIVAGVVLLILFLVSPLRTKEFWVALSRRFSLQRLILKLKEFLAYLRPKKGVEDEVVDIGGDDLSEVRRRLQTIADRRKDPKRQRQLGRMVKTYLRFLRWGTAKTFAYTTTTAPLEYGHRLAAAFPELAPEITAVSKIFEEALYANYPLSAESIRSFEAQVRKVERT